MDVTFDQVVQAIVARMPDEQTTDSHIRAFIALGLVGPDAVSMFLQSAPPEEILDLVMKRNLVFVSWRRGERTGTWVWSFDREGRIIAWTSM